MASLTRRQWLGLTAVAGGATAFALRPAETGAPHDAFFKRLSQALHQAGLSQPTLVIDRERLHANAHKVRSNLDAGLALRLVNKSLPSLPLLDEVARLTGTRRQMVFNLPYLQTLAEQRPDSDVLLGKPFPVAAAAHLLAHPPRSGFDVSRQVQWLIDSPARLAQYRDLARAQRGHFQRVGDALDLQVDGGPHTEEQIRACLLDHEIEEAENFHARVSHARVYLTKGVTFADMSSSG